MKLNVATTIVVILTMPGCELFFMNRAQPDPQPSSEDLLTVEERDLNGDGDLFEEEGMDVTAPMLDGIALPELRPLGAADALVLDVSDDQGLAQVRATFGTSVAVAVSGLSATVLIDATSLGEGMGTLIVEVENVNGLISFFTFDDVVVDLSPPTVDVGPTIIRRGSVDEDSGMDGELSLWMGDAWMLASIEVEFGGTTLSHVLPPGWPQTLGELWDWSYVTFPASSFPEATGLATFRVVDAAGNAYEEVIELTVDGTAPSVALTAVASPATGELTVDVSGTDDTGGPVWIDLRARGLVVAQATGPSARITLPAADFAAGTVELVAVARDQAGNETRSAPVVVAVP